MFKLLPFAIALANLSNVLATPLHSQSISRRATCTPTSAGNEATDDTPAITKALADCGNGGIILIPAGKTYSIRTTLSFAGCKSCDFQIEGTLKASDDLDYWEGKNSIFQIESITGAKIHSLTGTGSIDGNGQAAYDRFAADSSYARPTLMYITKSTGITVDNLDFINAPNVFHSTAGNSKDIVYSNIHLASKSTSDNAAKNTDGWDVGAASYVTLTNINVSNQDDCVAFKPGGFLPLFISSTPKEMPSNVETGANYVTVTNITCTGSHGLSVGSLGKTNTDTVTNIYVSDATMINSSKAVGIKYYPGGFGNAVVKNVTYDGVTVTNSDYAIQIQSCYGQDADYCTTNPSNATLEDIYFKNFKGTTSTKYKGDTSNLNCSEGDLCDVHISGYEVKAESGTAEVLCVNTPSDLGVECVIGASG